MLLYFFLSFILFDASLGDDKPCQARLIANRSVVCVCNATYCDEVTRDPITSGSFVQYTSSEAGSRFKKLSANLQNYVATTDADSCPPTIELDPRYTNQTLLGFGGGISDSAGINWQNLSDSQLKQNLIDSYFSAKGLEYNMIRVPIGGSDFSTHPYAYNECPANDTNLSNFTLAYEDYAFKIPMIKAAFAAATAQIDVVASTWSPPLWMKSNDKYSGKSHLLDEYFQTFALYHKKFIDAYNAEGIPIWAVTTTNEPLNGLISFANFNDLGWIVKKLGDWIADNLGPTLKDSNVKILAVDDQRFTIPLFFNYVVLTRKEALQYIDGVAVHWYADDITPASMMVKALESYPDKFVIYTESAEGSKPSVNPMTKLGSWEFAEHYAKNILDDLNHNVAGWIDWNMCLNEQGGPNWVGNYIDSPVIVFPENGEFVKNPMFYVLGHFSKFLPRGSKKIQASVVYETDVWNVAFLTPNNTIVAVLYNKLKEKRSVRLKIGNSQAIVEMEPRSIVTVELPNEY